MIRHVLDRGAAFLFSDKARLGLAVVAVTLGLQAIGDMVQRQGERLDTLDEQIADRQQLLNAIKAELGQAMNAEQAYPAGDDVDPLQHGMG